MYLANLLKAFMVTPLEEIKQILLKLQYSFNLEAQSGVLLTYLGELVGRNRTVDDDELYRKQIKAKIVENSSLGRVKDILDSMSSITLNRDNYVVQYYPRMIELYVNCSDDVIQEVVNTVKNTKLGGVHIGTVFKAGEGQSGYFGWAEDDNALGFDEGYFEKIFEV